MQGLFTYIYHIVLIITFVRTIESCSNTVRITGQSWTAHSKWMFILLLAESIGSFALDIGYISDSPIGTGSLLILVKLTIDSAVYVFLNRFISDYLSLPKNNAPYIVLGVLYAASAMLVLLSGDYPVFSLGQSLVCLGPVYSACIALREIKAAKNVSYKNSASMLKGIILFMIMIAAQNLLVYYTGRSGWLGLRYMVSPIDDVFSLCMALTLQRMNITASCQASEAEISDNLKREGVQLQPGSGEKDKTSSFCNHFKLTGRESEIVNLILKGRSNQEISEELFISIGTVKHHVYNIFSKLEVERRSQLMRKYLEYRKETE